MAESCRDMCALVRNIVETVRVSGRGCQVDVRLSMCRDLPEPCGHRGPCSCCEFISATAGPCVTLVDAVIEPSRTRAGSCLRATLLVPVTVLLRYGGVNRTCQGEILIPIEGMMRSGCGPYQELVAQANVRVCGGCWDGDCVRLRVDYQAEVHAICMRAVRIPITGSCDIGGDCCEPYFNLPLYPR